jgi:hypothetical protein
MLCACGCGQETKSGNKHIQYHGNTKAGLKGSLASPWRNDPNLCRQSQNVNPADLETMRRNQEIRKKKGPGNQYSGSGRLGYFDT